jgi:mitogen-activated protein kinase kinase kinase
MAIDCLIIVIVSGWGSGLLGLVCGACMASTLAGIAFAKTDVLLWTSIGYISSCAVVTGGGHGFMGLAWTFLAAPPRLTYFGVLRLFFPTLLAIVLITVLHIVPTHPLPAWHLPAHFVLCMTPWVLEKLKPEVITKDVVVAPLNAVKVSLLTVEVPSPPKHLANSFAGPIIARTPPESPSMEPLKVSISPNENSSPKMASPLNALSPNTKMTLLQQRQGLTTGKTLVKWKKGMEIGRGAYGTVNIALNEFTGELMAVKHIVFDADDAHLKKKLDILQTELAVLRMLDHVNIVRYYFTERTSEQGHLGVNIFMEYVPGGSIAQVLQQFGKLSEAVVASYSEQVLLALNYLHKNSVVHRDIKCGNILLTTEGACKLADFGAAAQLDILASNHRMGTPLWMAPEVLLETDFDWRADIWSLGCTVIEMLTGRPPFTYLGLPTQADIVKHILSSTSFENLVQLEKFPYPLTCDCVDFLRSCLQMNPKDRLSCDELLEHLFIGSGGMSDVYVDVVLPTAVEACDASPRIDVPLPPNLSLTRNLRLSITLPVTNNGSPSNGPVHHPTSPTSPFSPSTRAMGVRQLSPDDLQKEELRRQDAMHQNDRRKETINDHSPQSARQISTVVVLTPQKDCAPTAVIPTASAFETYVKNKDD